MEERRTAELLSDFDDYKIGDAEEHGDTESESDSEPEPEPDGSEKPAAKKKKGRRS
jgi:hypothetical protein